MSDEALPGWHARLYREGDEHGIVALYERVFGYTRTTGWWRWKIKGRPAPVELTWVAVADATGEIIGHYPGIPITIKLEGKLRPAIVNLDVMTAPDFRKRGILLRLGEEANRHWAAHGYSTVVGLPNEQWGSRTAMLGWRTLFRLEWLRYPLHLGRVLARPGRLPRLLQPPARAVGEVAAQLWTRPRLGRLARSRRASVHQISAAGEEFDRLWSRLECYYPSCVVRDASYVQWRFLDARPAPYKLLLARRGEEPAGYIAYRAWSPRGGHTAYVGDIFAAPQDHETVNALLGAALRELWRMGVGTALVTAVPGSALYASLRAAGWLTSEAAFYYDLIPLDPSLDIDKLAHAELWLASGSDSDVV